MSIAGPVTNVWEAPVEYTYVTDDEGVRAALEWLRTKKVLGYDLETTGLDCFSDEVVLMQVGNTEHAYVFDVRKVSIEPLRGILEDPSILKIGHNIKFDYKFTAAQLDIRLENIADTMLAEKLLYAGLVENTKGPKEKALLPKKQVPMGLAGVCERYLGLKLDKTLQQSFIMVTRNTTFSPEQLDYAAKDVQVLPPIWKQQLAELDRRGMRKLTRIEMDAIAPTADMELAGWLLDRDRWRREIANHEQKAAAYGRELLEEMGFKRTGIQTSLFDSDEDAEGDNFTPLQSQPQLMAHFRRLGVDIESTDKKLLLDWEGRTKRRIKELDAEGADDENAQALRRGYSFVKRLLEYRQNAKLVQTYGESLLSKIHQKTGRLHGELDQMGTETGRFASNNPNLQNFPKEKWVRDSFLAGPGKVLATCDFSQIELRIVAQLSQDRIPIEAFNSGKDLHSLTAALMYGLPYDDFEPPDGSARSPDHTKKRSAAKTIVFGLAYGRGAKSLAMQLGCSEDEAKELMDRYFKTLPRVKEWLDKAGREAWENGFASTMLGRRRYFVMPPEDWKYLDREHPNAELFRQVRGSIERAGKNHPIQGCNADIVKLALPRLRMALRDIGGRLISTVHDEIIAEAPIEHTGRVAGILVTIMEGTAAEVLHSMGELKVNTKSECNVGPTWMKERDPCVVVHDAAGVEFGVHHHLVDRVEQDGAGNARLVLHRAPGAETEPVVETHTPYDQALTGSRGLVTVREACVYCSPGVFAGEGEQRRLIKHHDIERVEAAGEKASRLHLKSGTPVEVKGGLEKVEKRLAESAKACAECRVVKAA